MATWELLQYIETKLHTTCFHLTLSFFKNIFLLQYSINWPSLIAWLSLICEILGNMCIAIVCKPVCEVMNFEVKPIFLIKPFSLHNQKVVTKTKLSWKRKELLRWNEKKNHHFKRAFNQANNTFFFGRWEFDFKVENKWNKTTA